MSAVFSRHPAAVVGADQHGGTVEVEDSKGVAVGVEHVVVGDLVLPSARQNHTEMDTTVGNTVAIAVRALRQTRVGSDLMTPLRNDESDWLDAELG